MYISDSYVVVARDISTIRPSEEVDVADVERLARHIAAANMWIAPIPIDSETGVVMDGNHRVSAAQLLGLTHLPCILLDYTDSRVTVADWSAGTPFQVERIFRAIEENRILPYKSTKHSFSPPLPETSIPLDCLVLRSDCVVPVSLR